MGIVNVTPDSFSDGGAYFSAEKAVEHAIRLTKEGAHIVDIGGQSTRPGAAFVDATEECRRVIPVIENIVKKIGTPISVDTFNAAVARRAFDAGASWINDISAGRFDPAMPALIAEKGCPIILMHSRETPGAMQDHPSYNDVVAEVKKELRQRIDLFLAAGVRAENIIIDPGIGFAKRFEDNSTLLGRMDELVAMGHPVCLGASRKSFIGHITGKDPGHRLAGSLAAIAPAFHAGVKIFRVHDVEETVEFLKVLHAIRAEKTGKR
jgi:dihydropteroate synthase